MSGQGAGFRTIDTADVAGKRVLVRADLNVPAKNGKVTDATRIERLIPTVAGLTKRGAKVVLMSHFGRPDGERKPEYTLKPVADKLAELLGGTKVYFVGDCIGSLPEECVGQAANGDVVVLENLRFYPGEEKNDADFAKSLSRLGDIYVNDAFSVSHRAHASTEALAKLLPAYAGVSMMAELNALTSALETPVRPVAAVVGGAKVSTKIPILTNLASKVQAFVIGGGMANTFLFAQGHNVGKSLCEPGFAETAREIMAKAEASGCEILLPTDVVVAKEFKAGAECSVRAIGDVPDDGMILDIGPASVAALTERMKACKTVLWNGPVGAFEIAPFGEGTFALAREVANLTKSGQLVSVAGGGDTVAALNAAGVTGDFTYVSTAGGAFLEWLEGRTLPGVAVLKQ
jgi:phosphoglycerate kinase